MTNYVSNTITMPRVWVEHFEHNPNWEYIANNEMKLIADTLPKGIIVGMEHVGSTSIPGIKARPCIALNIAVKSIQDIAPYIDLFLGMGYRIGEFGGKAISILKSPRGDRSTSDDPTYQIYFLTVRHSGWILKSAFRDYLIAHPLDAKRYEAVKLRNRGIHYSESDYCKSKSEFCLEIFKRCGFTELTLDPRGRINFESFYVLNIPSNGGSYVYN
jgi:GrpB-like predicted nucleotidyltransferase (UPF0157 family)